MKYAKREIEEARELLAGMVKPGDTVYTILRHVSRSGMRREICPTVIQDGGQPRMLWWSAARLLGLSIGRDAVKIDGCGMDMGFHLVYCMSHALFRDGFGCIGEGCPSNDHSNGDRDYTPHAEQFTAETCPGRPCGSECDHKSNSGREHWHRDGGYALKHRWL